MGNAEVKYVQNNFFKKAGPFTIFNLLPGPTDCRRTLLAVLGIEPLLSR